jgi:hypothetical protein
MAEVGLLPFARIALQVSKAVLPRYRTRFSKHQFNQPQLLAILCLMRYEDWTFREAEVRLGEHRELRQALGLGNVPDFTTLYRFLQRLDDVTIDRAVGETVRRLRGTRRKARRRARVAVDATGLAQGAVSTFFVRRMHHHGQKPLPWRHWLKWVVAVDVDQQFVLSQIARRGPWNDCANLPTVVGAAAEQTRIGLVLADAEFDSERNHTYIRQQLGAQSVIPAKRGKKTWRLHGVRAEMRRAFPRRLYRRRALVETLFSSVKRKLSARAPGRSLRTQMRQALLLGLSFNLYRLRHRCLFSRMSTEPIHFRMHLILRGCPIPSKFEGVGGFDIFISCLQASSAATVNSTGTSSLAVAIGVSRSCGRFAPAISLLKSSARFVCGINSRLSDWWSCTSIFTCS